MIGCQTIENSGEIAEEISSLIQGYEKVLSKNYIQQELELLTQIYNEVKTLK